MQHSFIFDINGGSFRVGLAIRWEICGNVLAILSFYESVGEVTSHRHFALSVDSLRDGGFFSFSRYLLGSGLCQSYVFYIKQFNLEN